MLIGGRISGQKETPSTRKTLLLLPTLTRLKYLYIMELFETFGRIFKPELKPTHRLCRYCDCFHEQVGDFCSKECEDNYKWEYEQEFYKQNREQDAEHTLWLLTQQPQAVLKEN